MLSLRDSGKIRQDNESILLLAKNCGFPAHSPFSLADFIRKDCLVDTTIFRIGVVLVSWSPASPDLPQAPEPEHDKSWYENFFLNWGNERGVANFWYKQSFGKLKIEGKVLDWRPFQAREEDIFSGPDANGLLFIKRSNARSILDQGAAAQGGFPDDYDAFIGVFNLPAGHRIDGGSQGNFSAFGIGDSFAFHTHEVGHLIGGKFNFHHSFGIETATYCTGMYGHPYCVMSAEAYGAVNVVVNDSTAFPVAEENLRGPGLSGATRFQLGWANGFGIDLKNGEETSVSLQSLGSNQPGFQVIHIIDGDSVFCIEYRSSSDWNDRGIVNSGHDGAVVVSALTGGIATKLAPACATFLGEIPINFSMKTIPDAIVNFNPFWGVRIIGFTERKSRVQLKVFRSRVFSVRTYRRTHQITLSSDGVNSWDIINIVAPEDQPKFLRACEDYQRINAWQIDGHPITNLRSLI